ncbi:MAG: hypothetical protein CVU06_12665 [Bacteroidetes bacterium HGW-Bacteroidetes-22]|nr:MAG: hypothetical protein CVU06_12665 [Bacteroidetes bacterium HGW-Bacteroidetes-22]
MRRKIVILGSTGSIGKQTLDIIKNYPDKFEVVGLGGWENTTLLKEQIISFRPKISVVKNEYFAKNLRKELNNFIKTKIYWGIDGLIKLSILEEVDMVVVAISGIASLIPTFEAIKHRKKIALASKEATMEEVASNEEVPADSTGMPADSGDMKGPGGKGTGSSDPKTREFYLSKLPLTPEAINKSDKKIIEALFKAAFIYREGLTDLESSLSTFEDLITRYPDTAINHYYILSVYMASTLSKQLGLEDKAAEFAQIIINGYPNSDYALILKDPSFVAELERVNRQATVFYEETFNAYKSKQFYSVLLNCDIAREQYGPKHELMPRFEFLRAMSIGNLEVVDSLAANLQRLVKTYPRDPVTSEAMKVLDKIARSNPELAVSAGINKLPDPIEPVAISSKYKINSRPVLHSCLVIVKTDSVDVNVVKIRLSDFNTKSFQSNNYSISSLLLDNIWQIVNVSGFKNQQEAMDYYNTLMQNPYILAPIGKVSHYIFVISSENYPIFYGAKDLKEYELFFRSKYFTSQPIGK